MTKYRPIIIGRLDRNYPEFPLFDSADEARQAAWKHLLKLSNMERRYTGISVQEVTGDPSSEFLGDPRSECS